MADKFASVLSKVGIDQGGADISTKKGDVHITGVEVAFFNKIFSIVDTDADDKVRRPSLRSWSRLAERKVLSSSVVPTSTATPSPPSGRRPAVARASPASAATVGCSPASLFPSASREMSPS